MTPRSLLSLRTLRSTAVTLALTAVAHAATFDFSYTFGDGTIVTGTLDGVQNGAYVEHASATSLFINGTQVTGPLFTATSDGSAYLAGATVSFDAVLNNFTFANSDLAVGDYTFDTYFAFLPPALGDSVSLLSFTQGLTPSDAPASPQSWSLTAAPVPDASATATLLGLGTLALLTLRRRIAA